MQWLKGYRLPELLLCCLSVFLGGLKVPFVEVLAERTGKRGLGRCVYSIYVLNLTSSPKYLSTF